MKTLTEHLPHQSADKIATCRRWAGFVGTDNLAAIRDRIADFAKPGRTLTVITWDERSDGPREVRSGLTLAVRSEAFREPIEMFTDENNAYVSVSLAPGINSFGVRADRWFGGIGDDAPGRCMTGDEVRDFAWAENGPGWQGWHWIRFAEEGSLTQRPMIEIRHQNEHGYRETKQILVGDIHWQQRAERDAITADQIAAALTAAPKDEWCPSAGIDPEEAATAARVVAQLAANLRRSKEPLVQDEVYPVVDNL